MSDIQGRVARWKMKLGRSWGQGVEDYLSHGKKSGRYRVGNEKLLEVLK